MPPILFAISKLSIYVFGFSLALAFLVIAFMVWKQARRRGLLEEKYLDTVISTGLVAIIAARVGYVITHWAQFKIDPARAFFFLKYPGLSLESGVAGGIGATVLFSFLSGLSILETLDIFALAFATGAMVGYAGCFLGQCMLVASPNYLLALLIASFITMILLQFVSRSLHRSVRMAKFTKRYGMIFLFYLIFWSLSLLILSVGFPRANQEQAFPLAILVIALGFLFIRYPDIFSMTQFPKSLLDQMHSYLENRTSALEKKMARLKKEDPFQDKTRFVDQAAEDAEAHNKARHEQVSALQRQINLALAQTRKALAKIKIGKYGICESCGKPIETGRLAAMPEATLCVACEQKREK